MPTTNFPMPQKAPHLARQCEFISDRHQNAIVPPNGAVTDFLAISDGVSSGETAETIQRHCWIGSCDRSIVESGGGSDGSDAGSDPMPAGSKRSSRIDLRQQRLPTRVKRSVSSPLTLADLIALAEAEVARVNTVAFWAEVLS